MKKPFLSVKLKDPQPYYVEDESVECVVELKSEKVLKDPVITVVFKGRSSSYSNFSRIYHVPIFDIEQEIKHPTIDMNAAVGRVVSAEFKVEVPKGTFIPSSRVLEGGDGGKIEYMVEAVLSAAGIFKRSILATSIVVIPIISRINVDKEELSRPLEKETRWPRNEADANTCILTASIPRGGWVRGSNVPVYISWKQPERMNTPQKVSMMLVRQELISSSRDTPPDMTKQLKDKLVETTEKELALINGPNRTLNTSLQHSIEIPSNIVPTINENGKVIRLDYKICVTVHVPGMESNGRDKELSINLPIIIGTEGKMINLTATFDENHFNNNNVGGGGGGGGMYSENLVTSPGGFRMPEPIVHHNPNAYPPPPNHFIINPEKNIFSGMNRVIDGDDDDDSLMPTGMPVPFIDRSSSVMMEDPRYNKTSTGYFSPNSIPDCYPPLDSPTLMPESHISLESSSYSPMPTPRMNNTNSRDSQYYDPNFDDDDDNSNVNELTPHRVTTSRKNVKPFQEVYYKPEERSPK